MAFREEESSPPPGWNTVIEKLAQGLDSVDKLASLLQLGSPNRPPGTATAALLVEQIKGAISKAIDELAAGDNMVANQVDSSSTVTVNRPRTSGKRKTQSTRTAAYRRRGSPYSCTRISSSHIDDGHTWRKYGQKDIFTSKYPRSYFRCTYKFDRDCKASKQVQRSEEDPSLFIITYFGEHTCGGEAKKAMPPTTETCIINFESKKEGNVEQQGQPFLPSLKQESEEVLSNVSSAGSPSDYVVPAEVGFEESGMDQMAPGIMVEHDESSSGLLSCFNNGMEFLDFLDFDLFSLDHSGIFQD